MLTDQQDNGGLPKYLRTAQEQNALGRGLPADFYTDPVLYATEQRELFARGWVPVCRADQLPAPKAYRPADAAGFSILLTNDADGRLRVFPNACAHRSMRLVDGPGAGSRMTCPYHRWTFGLDGGLQSAPLVGPRIDREACSLTEIPHELWQGWLFVNPGGGAEPLGPSLVGLDAALAGWGLADMVTVAAVEFDSEWNWKVMWENFNEYYHHLGTHADTLDPLLPARTARTLDNNGEPWSCASMTCGEDYLSMQPFVDLSSCPSTDMHLFSVFPLLCAGVQPGSAFWLRIIPETATRHRVSWEFLLPPEELGTPYFEERLAATMDGLQAIHREDMEACALVQRGLSGGLAAPARLTEFDRPVNQLHEWLLRRLVSSF
ncbi:Phenylpropionate dioxygenase large terminal subunit [Kitasatospora sp. MMS16-BH015]|uniref:aromatic ring-hydroxylating oxygenase subunit alpha n=1 Tax=Kitasatospora sp. MMS16-BH015 TaxID=2018025 RepID=UPI000CA2B28C|nr:aromatic ring-hydroxylating dioxygenase subunit alpha [Kitasatospora sp. MMS16-BH015]AUG76131.1 Phenylpropionate dioxygenase large terminal subunit [Kitasatospora sp. MMS16-BH015]